MYSRRIVLKVLSLGALNSTWDLYSEAAKLNCFHNKIKTVLPLTLILSWDYSGVFQRLRGTKCYHCSGSLDSDILKISQFHFIRHYLLIQSPWAKALWGPQYVLRMLEKKKTKHIMKSKGLIAAVPRNAWSFEISISWNMLKEGTWPGWWW